MQLADMLDIDLLERHLADGYVRRQVHPTLPLAILNYTEKTVFQRAYDEVTLQTRGLVVDEETGEIVCRSFRRFFNFEEPQFGRIPSGHVIVMPKLDGSLFLTAESRHGLITASRGSFMSEQSIWARDFYDANVSEWGFIPQPGKTYVSEILASWNRIVVSYPEDSLTLLAVIDNESGQEDLQEFDACAWPDKVEKRLVHFADQNGDALYAELDKVSEDDEGLVFYWPHSNTRCKLKKTRYVLLHKILTNTTSRSIWEFLSTGKPLHTLFETVPDEFIKWVEETAADLQVQYSAIHTQAVDDFVRLEYLLPDRKAFAAQAKKTAYPGLVFLLADGKSPNEQIWKMIRPSAERPFVYRPEAVA